MNTIEVKYTTEIEGPSGRGRYYVEGVGWFSEGRWREDAKNETLSKATRALARAVVEYIDSRPKPYEIAKLGDVLDVKIGGVWGRTVVDHGRECEIMFLDEPPTFLSLGYKSDTDRIEDSRIIDLPKPGETT